MRTTYAEVCRRFDELLAASSAALVQVDAELADPKTVFFYGHLADDDAVVVSLDLPAEVTGEFDHERFERELAEAWLLFH